MRSDLRWFCWLHPLAAVTTHGNFAIPKQPSNNTVCSRRAPKTLSHGLTHDNHISERGNLTHRHRNPVYYENTLYDNIVILIYIYVSVSVRENRCRKSSQLLKISNHQQTTLQAPEESFKGDLISADDDHVVR